MTKEVKRKTFQKMLTTLEYFPLFSLIYWGGGPTQKKSIGTHPKIPEIDLDFFRLLLTFNKIVQILS